MYIRKLEKQLSENLQKLDKILKSRKKRTKLMEVEKAISKMKASLFEVYSKVKKAYLKKLQMNSKML